MTSERTPQDVLRELRQLSDAATPGPWRSKQGYAPDGFAPEGYKYVQFGPTEKKADGRGTDQLQPEDADLIVAAVNYVRSLDKAIAEAPDSPLSHGFSPRPGWAGTCPRCGAKAGDNCAVLTAPDTLSEKPGLPPAGFDWRGAIAGASAKAGRAETAADLLARAMRDDSGVCRICGVVAAQVHLPDCPVAQAVAVMHPEYARPEGSK